MEEDWDETGSAPEVDLPQRHLTWLFSRGDFDEHVKADKENLCCVMVTSTLCPHSGIRKLKYPKIKTEKEANRSDDGEDEPEDAEDEEDEEDEEETEAGALQRSNFFRDVVAGMIDTEKDIVQRRHIRFFHVCACTEEEVNIAPLIANDPTFALYNRKPNELEVKELRRTAHRQLVELLQLLEVHSTPCLLFFLLGEPVRYSMMVKPAPEHRMENATGERDQLRAVGSNIVKWRRVLKNATVVRNEAMREYDEEVREKARQARREQRKKEREERRRLRKLQADEEEEDEEEDDY